VVNDLPGVVRLARGRGLRVCADCISSLGALPLDLSEVYLATGTSGKSLGSYAGAAIVFADRRALAHLDARATPSYLDLTATLANVGPRFTFPSPTLRALEAALAAYATPELAHARYEHYASLGAYVRQQLRVVNLKPLADDSCACPVVATFVPPGTETSQGFVDRCQSWGYVVGGQSGYLAERRLVQIATMGDISREVCAPLFDYLRNYLAAGRNRPDRRESASLNAV